MLPAAQDERSHGKLLRLLQRIAQQRVDALAVLVGHEVVGRLEVVRRDRVAVDEGRDVDSPRGFHVRATEVLVREHHVFTFLILVPLHDVVPVDHLAGGLVVTLVSHRREVALVEQVEIDAAGFRRGVQRHGNVNQAEADGAVPQPTRATALAAAGVAFRTAAFLLPRNERSPPAPVSVRVAPRGAGSPGRARDDAP